MVDNVDKSTRSRIMSRVRSGNTAPEKLVRKALHRLGLRYRLHDSKLPGRPDVVFPRFRSILLVHGCFWHRHGCSAATTPNANRDYWTAKFARNVARDREVIEALEKSGWRVRVVWECTMRSRTRREAVLVELYEWITGRLPEPKA